MNRRRDESTQHALLREGRICGALATTLILTLAATAVAQETDGTTCAYDAVFSGGARATEQVVDGGPGTDIDRVDDDLQVDSLMKKNLE